MRKTVSGLLLVLMMAALPACENAKVGARCSPSQGAAKNATHVLFCMKGRWKASLTIGQAAEIIVGNLPGSINSPRGSEVTTQPGQAIFTILTVTTRSGRPAAGTDITLLAPATGPGFAGSNERTFRTDGNGRVLLNGELTAGPVTGDFDVKVSASSLKDAFTLKVHVKPGKPASIAVISGADQSIEAGGSFAPFVVEVRDISGAPVPGAAVSVTDGGLSPYTNLGPLSVTESNGTVTIAAGPQYDAESNAFTVRITEPAPMGGTRNVASVQVGWTVRPSAPDDVEVEFDGQTTTPSTRFGAPIYVSVIDQFGNIVRGVPVTLTVIPGQTGASGTLTSIGDNFGAGAAAYVDANGITGDFNVRADVAGLGFYDFTLHIIPA